MSMGLFKRVVSYNGSLEFTQLNDEVIAASFQHKYLVEKYLHYIKYKKVLDAGCWTGSFEKALTEKAVETELIGFDENEIALNIARKEFPGYKFLKGMLTDPDEKFITAYAGYFDTIVFLDVIEHLPLHSEEKVVKFLHSLLKPAGVMVMSTMADHIFNFIDPAWFCGHRHYSLKAIQSIMENSGFQIKETLKIGNLYWDLDLLYFYIHKHIFKKQYTSSAKMTAEIMKGFNSPRIPTRYYLLARKAG
jgi:2-polyprenyl-3-methyl-5-hydroxy-6-metoxy-1,4-benzoquinol methylase